MERLLGFPIPQWIIPKIPGLYQVLADYFAYIWGYLPFPNDLPSNLQQELKKISSGFLLAEIMDRMALKIKCSKQVTPTKECAAINGQKFYGYSGHDITQISLFLGLGYQTFFVPNVGSAAVLELWENVDFNKTAGLVLDDQYYVKIYQYETSDVKNPTYIGCPGPKGCPISYLSTKAELLRPTPNLKSFCQQPL
uniref:acid phosphatase n=1 Tax=Panagrolaimus davidi TaxID=227884 RepID=A0A914QCB2_9BILA